MIQQCFGSRSVFVSAFALLCCILALHGTPRSTGGCAQQLLRLYEQFLGERTRSRVATRESSVHVPVPEQTKRTQVLLELVGVRSHVHVQLSGAAATVSTTHYSR